MRKYNKMYDKNSGKCAIRKAYGPGTQMFQFGGATHDKDVLMGIAAECTMKLVSGEIAKDDAKSWCNNRATTL